MASAIRRIEENTGQYKWNVTDAGDYVETNLPVPPEYS